jgi:hypothetical protein
MSDYQHILAYLDPLGITCAADGRCWQDIELLLTDDPDRDPPSLADPACQLDPRRARELANQLLGLAELAEPRRLGQAR